jgi:hypothetical protein
MTGFCLFSCLFGAGKLPLGMPVKYSNTTQRPLVTPWTLVELALDGSLCLDHEVSTYSLDGSFCLDHHTITSAVSSSILFLEMHI